MSSPIRYEPYGALDYLFTVLNSLVTGGAHNKVAPPGTVAPFFVYTSASGDDLMSVGAIRVWNDGLYLVKACGPATMANTLYTLAATADSALHNTGGVIAANGGVLMLSCTSEQTIDQDETVNGELWLNVVSTYRLYNQARP